MDPFSTAASGIAVVSLALQLIQSVDTIHTCIRKVKDAPKELKSLAGRLEQLGALLKDVHQLVQHQAALPKHVEAPSATITCCLHSCEESLVPLQEIVDEYTTLQARNRSTAARLKGDIKLSMKARDIASIEKRIQYEVSNLMSAVIVSNATFQITTVSRGRVHPGITDRSKQQMAVAIQGDRDEFRSRSSAVRVARETVNVPAVWRLLGLSKQRSTYRRRNDASTTTENEEIQSEAYEYLWQLPMLRRVLRWNQTTTYGTLTTSFTVYPVVHEFDESVEVLLKNGSVQDFQQLLASGALHPFTRNRYGESLLHKSIEYARLDICRTLSACGLQPDVTHHGRGFSPLTYFRYFSVPPSRPLCVDLLRYFLLDLDRVDDFESGHWNMLGLIGTETDVTEWMWRYSATALEGTEKIRLQDLLLEQLIWMLSLKNFRERAFLLLQSVAALLDPDLHSRIAEGRAGLLNSIMGEDTDSEDSASTGYAFISFLQQIGVDYVEAIGSELDTIDSNIVRPYGYASRRILFYQDGKAWTLEWEYIFEDEDSSSQFMAEFTALTADARFRYVHSWPFFDIDWKLPTYEEMFKESPKWESRFDRRRINKARKELARSGQKRTQSRMPGSWVS